MALFSGKSSPGLAILESLSGQHNSAELIHDMIMPHVNSRPQRATEAISVGVYLVMMLPQVISVSFAKDDNVN